MNETKQLFVKGTKEEVVDEALGMLGQLLRGAKGFALTCVFVNGEDQGQAYNTACRANLEQIMTLPWEAADFSRKLFEAGPGLKKFMEAVPASIQPEVKQ